MVLGRLAVVLRRGALWRYAFSRSRRSFSQAAWEKEQRERERMYRQAAAPRRTSTTTRRTTTSRKKQDPLEKAINSAANTVGRALGKQIVRGLFGTFRR